MHKYILGFIAMFMLGSVSPAEIEIGNKRLRLNIEGNTLKIPYFSNYPLDETRTDLTSAVIIMHGATRNASSYFNTVMEAAGMSPNDSDSTLIIAPQFLTEDDLNFHALDDEHLYWSAGGWKSGSNSLNNDSSPRPKRISSYAVLDSILFRLTENFPNVKSVVFAGHSAGGQVVNRYAASSPMIDILCQQYQINIKFLVANPSSYLYLDDRRKITGSTDQFEVPDSTGCPKYNEWKYGLDDLYIYPTNIGADSIINNYQNREIVYLLGGDDNDPNSSSLDKSCEATFQGDHRLERGSIYFNFLQDYYGNEILNSHSLDTIPGVAHNNYYMFTSDIGLYHLFEAPPAECDHTITNIERQNIKNQPQNRNYHLNIYPNPSNQAFSVQFDESFGDQDFRIELYSALGVKIKVVTNQAIINLAEFSAGVYFLRIKLEGRLIKTEKIILIN